jgi:hypothetical protein
MMKIPAVLLPAAAALLLLSACDDATTGDSVPANSTEAKALLTAASWLPAAHTINPGFDMEDDGHVITNVFAIEPACSHDDIMRFTADGKWINDEGAQKCDAGDPQTTGGTWVLSQDADSLYLNSDDEPGEIGMKVASLTSTSFSLSGSSDNWPDKKSRLETYTWKAK